MNGLHELFSELGAGVRFSLVGMDSKPKGRVHVGRKDTRKRVAAGARQQQETPGDWMTTSEAAKAMRRARSTVESPARSGRLVARQGIDHPPLLAVLVDHSSAAAYTATRGRPRKGTA